MNYISFRYIIILFISLLKYGLNGQTLISDGLYNPSSIRYHDSHYYLASDIYNNIYQYTSISKIDTLGNVIWSVAIDGEAHINDMIVVSDGIIAIGRTSLQFPTTIDNNSFAIKIGFNGNVQKYIILDQVGAEDLTKIIELPENNSNFDYIILGYEDADVNSNYLFNQKITLFIVDENLNIGKKLGNDNIDLKANGLFSIKQNTGPNIGICLDSGFIEIDRTGNIINYVNSENISFKYGHFSNGKYNLGGYINAGSPYFHYYPIKLTFTIGNNQISSINKRIDDGWDTSFENSFFDENNNEINFKLLLNSGSYNFTNTTSNSQLYFNTFKVWGGAVDDLDQKKILYTEGAQIYYDEIGNIVGGPALSIRKINKNFNSVCDSVISIAPRNGSINLNLTSVKSFKEKFDYSIQNIGVTTINSPYSFYSGCDPRDNPCIADTTPPQLICGNPSINVELDQNGTAHVTNSNFLISAIDNCDLNVDITDISRTFTCSDLINSYYDFGVVASDDSGNSSNCKVRVNLFDTNGYCCINDTIPPIAIFPTDTIILPLDSNGEVYVIASDYVSATDNCGNVYFSGLAGNFNCSNLGNGPWGFAVGVTDSNGNSSTGAVYFDISDPNNYCCSHPDLSALQDFYDATNGDQWKNTIAGNKPWFEDCDPCGLNDGTPWYGITCNGNHRVSALGLNFNNLVGTIPPSIDGLSDVNWLVLYDNPGLSGSIPNTICNIPHLQFFSLLRNNHTGSIPPCMANMSSLIDVNFSGNDLSGTIPAFGSNNPSLANLILDNNQLSGSLPSTLINIPNPSTLTFNNNNLSGCYPPQLTDLCDFNMGTITGLDNSKVSDGNNFDAPWEDFCFTSAGSCTSAVFDESEYAIDLIPNPANDIIHVIGEGIQRIQIFNSQGQHILESETTDINIDLLNAGMYFVRIESIKGTAMKHFVKF